MAKCTSCNRELKKDYTEFNCPSCGKAKIVRCNRCKATVKKYKCPECGFIGP
jgi:hypothetical protein